MIGIASNPCRGAACAYAYPLRFRAAEAQSGAISPVTPVSPAHTVERQERTPALQFNAFRPELPVIREGADPVEMAVRGRIQYLDPAQAENAADKLQDPAASAEEAEKAASAQEVPQERECQTCKNRKYQDGSNDPGVSFKTATHLSPEQAATAVRGHEMEHVTREQAKADREGRKVLQQSVTIHTAICPECGDVYVSGGTTRTTTAADNRQQQEQAQQPRQTMFGHMIDVVA